MNQLKSKFLKGFGAIVLTLAMLITMIPATEVWADPIDYTAPVIESATLQEAGKTVKVGDTFTLDLKAYDQDSDLGNVTVCLSKPGESYVAWLNGYIEEQKSDNFYQVELQLSEIFIQGEYNIDFSCFRVYDDSKIL